MAKNLNFNKIVQMLNRMTNEQYIQLMADSINKIGERLNTVIGLFIEEDEIRYGVLVADYQRLEEMYNKKRANDKEFKTPLSKNINTSIVMQDGELYVSLNEDDFLYMVEGILDNDMKYSLKR